MWSPTRPLERTDSECTKDLRPRRGSMFIQWKKVLENDFTAQGGTRKQSFRAEMDGLRIDSN